MESNTVSITACAHDALATTACMAKSSKPKKTDDEELAFIFTLVTLQDEEEPEESDFSRIICFIYHC